MSPAKMDIEGTVVKEKEAYKALDATTTELHVPEEEDSDTKNCYIGSGIVTDLKARYPYYLSDWTDGFGFRLLRPATYIFFTSIIPAVTFGEQLADFTGNKMGGSQVIIATALCGGIQAFFGGQPMLIIGVAQPVIIVYNFMYLIAEDNEIPFRAFCSVTLFWTALMIMLLALSNATNYIHSFTRYSGETFGMLISILFIQQGISGLVKEFDEYEVNLTANPELKEISTAWNLFGGCWAVFLALGLVWSSFKLRGARSWWMFNKGSRRIISDFSTFFMVVLWTLISYAPRNTPDSVPRRLKITSPMKSPAIDTWQTLDEVAKLEGWHVGAAVLPAIVITVLFFFDHNVSSQLCQVKEFNMKKPHAYHWDFFLLGIMTLVCGLCGVPPANGAIPQAPLHTKNCSKVPEMRRSSVNTGLPAEKPKVLEQRWTGLGQSLLCMVCLFITEDVLKRIPRSVLWGFLIYMGLEALEGSQFWDRINYLFSDRKLRGELLATDQFQYLHGIPLKQVNKFTMVQIIGFGLVYGLVWAGDAGISFPLLIMAMVPVRKRLFPKIFEEDVLRSLDPSEADVEHDEKKQEEAQRNREGQQANTNGLVITQC